MLDLLDILKKEELVILSAYYTEDNEIHMVGKTDSDTAYMQNNNNLIMAEQLRKLHLPFQQLILKFDDARHHNHDGVDKLFLVPASKEYPLRKLGDLLTHLARQFDQNYILLSSPEKVVFDLLDGANTDAEPITDKDTLMKHLKKYRHHDSVASFEVVESGEVKELMKYSKFGIEAEAINRLRQMDFECVDMEKDLWRLRPEV